MTPIGSVFAPAPERPGIGSFDLAPGSYAVVCFLPQGATEGTGPPHFELGMIEEFTVD